MPTLKIKENKYEFSLTEIKQLIAEDLKTSPQNIEINYNLTIKSDVIDGKIVNTPKFVSISVQVND